ncbi:MAG: Holliday junction resolvase RuvX [Syntrophomonadaceae bacterium]|nr:Holliday junction resolvase RuvX [Syntrophomonadaceae bacterium]
MRVIGLDWGAKRIGVAVSDEMGWTAQAYATVPHHSQQATADAIGKICEEVKAERIVLGLPLNMDGTRGPKALEAEEFGRLLERNLGLPVEYQDERLSTVSSNRVLLQADLSRKRRREIIDRLAAAVILQTWLDKHSKS